jgi:hypothetical protein
VATVVVSPPRNITFDWTAGRHAGWPKGKSRMVALLGNNVNLTYVFPFTPVQIEFSDLSNNYTEIERPGNYKLIERRSPNLTRVSFSFLAVDRDSQGKRSIENQLRFLNRISTANAPIAFAGLGALLGVSQQGTYRLWRITDFSFSVTRKNQKNEASQAECRITLVEDRNPILPVADLGQIKYDETPPRLSDDKTTSSTPAGILGAALATDLQTYLRDQLRLGGTRTNTRTLIQRFLQGKKDVTASELDVLTSSYNNQLFRVVPTATVLPGTGVDRLTRSREALR